MNQRQKKRIGRERVDEPQEARDKEFPDDPVEPLSRLPSGQHAAAACGSDGGRTAAKDSGKPHRPVTRYLMLQLPREKHEDDRLVGDECTLAMLRALNELAALLHRYNCAVG